MLPCIQGDDTRNKLNNMPPPIEVYHVPSIFDPAENYDSQTSPGKYLWRQVHKKISFKRIIFSLSKESVYVDEFYGK